MDVIKMEMGLLILRSFFPISLNILHERLNMLLYDNFAQISNLTTIAKIIEQKIIKF